MKTPYANNKNTNINKPHVNKAPTNADYTQCDYSYYSRILNKPFDSLAELQQAEAAYHKEQQAKEDRAAIKKADAKKVEDAFKTLNAARKVYKDDLNAATKKYSENLIALKNAFESERAVIQATLAAAEENYSNALQTFTGKYPEGYHLTLRDGDFESTISKASTSDSKAVNLPDLFDLIFNW